MPVVAVAGIIGSASAIAGGTLGVMGTIAAIGTIVSSVGVLTGNKTLMKIGAVAGLAGGIGAFAQSQGWLASSSAAETAANAAGESSAIDAMKNASSGAEAVNPTDAALQAGTKVSPLEAGQLDVASAAGQSEGLAGAQSIADTVSQASPELATTAAQGSQPAGLMDTANPIASANPTDLRLQDGVQQSPMEAVGADTSTMGGLADASQPISGGFNAAKDSQAANQALSLTADAKAGGTKILDLFDKVFRRQDGSLDPEMMKMASSFVGGAFDNEKAAKTAKLEAEADAIKQQMENANAVPAMNFKSKPAPGGTFRPTAPTYQPVRVGGLMNAR